MGIAIGSETINLEKRYSGIRIQKDMNSANAVVTIVVDTGYHEPSGKWRTTEQQEVRFDADRMWYMFGLTEADLGLTNPNLGTFLQTAIYGIAGGSIPLTCQLDVIVNDEYGNPVSNPFNVKDSTGRDVAFGTTGTTVDIPLLRNAVIHVNRDGYQPIAHTESLLQGSRTITFSLTPKIL